MTQQTKFTFNPKGWKIKTEYRSKNRMKFQLKLNQEEAEAFRNFANTVKPEDALLRNNSLLISSSTWKRIEQTTKPLGLPLMHQVSLQVLTKPLLVVQLKSSINY